MRIVTVLTTMTPNSSETKRVLCTTYLEKYSTVKGYIMQGKSIYLHGNGNNGKTYILKKLREDPDCSELMKDYLVTEIVFGDMNIMFGNEKLKVILECNSGPTDYLDGEYVEVIFKGQWDGNTNTYKST